MQRFMSTCKKTIFVILAVKYKYNSATNIHVHANLVTYHILILKISLLVIVLGIFRTKILGHAKINPKFLKLARTKINLYRVNKEE